MCISYSSKIVGNPLLCSDLFLWLVFQAFEQSALLCLLYISASAKHFWGKYTFCEKTEVVPCIGSCRQWFLGPCGRNMTQSLNRTTFKAFTPDISLVCVVELLPLKSRNLCRLWVKMCWRFMRLESSKPLWRQQFWWWGWLLLSTDKRLPHSLTHSLTHKPLSQSALYGLMWFLTREQDLW